MSLEVISFIRETTGWEEILAGHPYYVKAKRDDGLVLLKYDQIRSDFTLPIVRECRGLILDERDNFRPVCVPFFKFGNFGESYVPEIEWRTARVQEKIDGSIIKLWHYRGGWHVSSNGEIDARNARVHSALMLGMTQTSLYALFMEAWDKTGASMENLNKGYTYMFELTSPHNRVVVKYADISIRHIGTRDNTSLLECDIDIGIAKPRTFPLSGLDACIESAKRLGYNDEGYVVVDQYYNRIKIKSPRYVALNHLVQGVTTLGAVVEIIQKNEQEEFLTYFPEYRDVFNKVIDGIKSFSKRQSDALERIGSIRCASRKELAEEIKKEECPACLFALIDGKEATALDWLLSRPAAKILMLIGIDIADFMR